MIIPLLNFKSDKFVREGCMHIEVFTEFCKVIHTYTCSFLFYRVIEVDCLGRKEGRRGRQTNNS